MSHLLKFVAVDQEVDVANPGQPWIRWDSKGDAERHWGGVGGGAGEEAEWRWMGAKRKDNLKKEACQHFLLQRLWEDQSRAKAVTGLSSGMGRRQGISESRRASAEEGR